MVTCTCPPQGTALLPISPRQDSVFALKRSRRAVPTRSWRPSRCMAARRWTLFIVCSVLLDSCGYRLVSELITVAACPARSKPRFESTAERRPDVRFAMLRDRTVCTALERQIAA